MSLPTYKFTLVQKSGLEVEVCLPAKFDVCPTCQGRGKIVNPSIDGNGISPEEFREDPDFEEFYFAGHYDIPCPECKGQRVVEAVDKARLTPAQHRQLREHERQQYESAREWESERHLRRMESGERW